ncbi:hypothetical protein BO70DRAFT_44747 [Aspergillus heteromorphus CBS 117.55]|uniref:Uncharacterized protein n=1 Tax=Aspergillus heteromorphus CBS 117.55 TaxID=1448321 RepID=A0A317W4L0_9EURO|nr:uncharacterized protein BO70DRAFT_44747 [Aspergillus heteromorphus CBS 117.55]PWY80501.1 hypothetical protein BO70DRAFT_44747 [Aspergillus heteromorphus CBS 117.55]
MLYASYPISHNGHPHPLPSHRVEPTHRLHSPTPPSLVDGIQQEHTPPHKSLTRIAGCRYNRRPPLRLRHGHAFLSAIHTEPTPSIAERTLPPPRDQCPRSHLRRRDRYNQPPLPGLPAAQMAQPARFHTNPVTCRGVAVRT